MANEIAVEVIIVDDDPSIQRALNRLLRIHGFSRRIFSNAQEFLADRNPIPAVGCMLLDVNMPGLSGLELQAELQRLGFRLPIVFLTAHGTVPASVQAMKLGAMDFLQKPFDSQDLIAIIRKAIDRSRQQFAEVQECRDLEQRFAAISPRERDVFRLVVKGLLNKQIAFELGIVEKTVKVHRARVMEKMQANSLAELVRMAETLRLPPCCSSILSSPHKGPEKK
jgi:RNA polymerase sigma factor (sigma-70 family)